MKEGVSIDIKAKKRRKNDRRFIFSKVNRLIIILTMKLFFLVALLLVAGLAQNLQPPSAEVQALVNNDPQLLTTLNNYFGCAKWDGTVCLECAQHFFFNVKGICCQVSPQCRLFNQDVGICEKCYEGYGLNNGTCQIIPADQQVNPDCQKWDGNHKCLECSVRFYPNGVGKCVPVSDFCRTWDSSNGHCLTCYYGYVLNTDGQCVENPHPFTPASNSLCKQWNDTNVCVACSERAYFNIEGVCVPVSSNCNTWDPFSGFCLTCYKGFVLIDGSCSLAPEVKPSDLGCKSWDWDSQTCLSCSKDFVFNKNDACVPVSDLCKESDSQTGLCTACFKGYDLTSGSCLVSPSNSAVSTVLGCKTWDWDNHKCLACSTWYFMNKGVCQAVNNYCSSFDYSKSVCLACYKGYHL